MAPKRFGVVFGPIFGQSCTDGLWSGRPWRSWGCLPLCRVLAMPERLCGQTGADPPLIAAARGPIRKRPNAMAERIRARDGVLENLKRMLTRSRTEARSIGGRLRVELGSRLRRSGVGLSSMRGRPRAVFEPVLGRVAVGLWSCSNRGWVGPGSVLGRTDEDLGLALESMLGRSVLTLETMVGRVPIFGRCGAGRAAAGESHLAHGRRKSVGEQGGLQHKAGLSRATLPRVGRGQRPPR